MVRLALILLLPALLLGGCTKPVESPAPANPAGSRDAPSPPAAPVRTDRSSYVLTNGPQGPEATIVTTLRAPANQSLYLVNCNGQIGVNLQRKVGAEWVYAWTVMMNACLSAPIVIPPDGEHTARVYLHERSGGVTYPQRARMIESGTYRVVWSGVLTSFDASGRGPEAPLEQRVSAPITIEVPPLTELTVAEAERLVRLLADAINDPARDPSELTPYVLHGPEALRVALVQYRTALGTVASVRRVKEFIFQLQGAKERRSSRPTGKTASAFTALSSTTASAPSAS